MADGTQDSPEVRMNVWSPELELLVAVFDRLGSVIAAVIAANGGKAPDIPPLPRPVTAFDRVRNQMAKERREKLVKRLLN